MLFVYLDETTQIARKEGNGYLHRSSFSLFGIGTDKQRNFIIFILVYFFSTGDSGCGSLRNLACSNHGYLKLLLLHCAVWVVFCQPATQSESVFRCLLFFLRAKDIFQSQGFRR